MQVVKGGPAVILVVVFSPVHVEYAICRRKSMAISGLRRRSLDSIGEVRPGHGDGVKGVKVAEGTTRASITTRAAMHVELAPRRREAVFKSGRRGDAGGCVGEVRPDLRNRVEGVEIAQQVVMLIYAPVNV